MKSGWFVFQLQNCVFAALLRSALQNSCGFGHLSNFKVEKVNLPSVI